MPLPNLNINVDWAIKAAAEVERLIITKKFLDDPKTKSPVRQSNLLVTEIAEMFQEYKRHGLANGAQAMARECADIVIRAMNWWVINEYEFNSDDAHNVIQHSRYNWCSGSDDLDIYIWMMTRIAHRWVDSHGDGPARLIGLCIYFCENVLQIEFTQVFREVMDKCWSRPEKYNLSEEHFKKVIT